MFGGADPVSATLEMTARFRPESIHRATGGGDGSCDSFARAYHAAPSRDALRRIMYGDVASYMTDDILAKVDRASMSVALEVRVPIVDHRVVRYALSLPRSVIWREGRTKAPLRAILDRRVPRELIDRPKHGFGIPIHELLANELTSWKARYLDLDRIREEGILDPAGVAELVREADGGYGRVGASRLWLLICFQRWYARTHLGERDL
jgi:asparagine synthase (glutamine-hydrolysing)